MFSQGIEHYRPVFFDDDIKTLVCAGYALSEGEYFRGGGGRLGAELRGVIGAWVEETPRTAIQHKMSDVHKVVYCNTRLAAEAVRTKLHDAGLVREKTEIRIQVNK